MADLATSPTPRLPPGYGITGSDSLGPEVLTESEGDAAYAPVGETIYVSNLVADGVTNEDTLVQNAIVAANAAGGGTVVLVAIGTIICDSLPCYNNVHVQGLGRGLTTLKRRDGTQGSIFVSGDSTASLTGVEISDMTIDGNRAGQTGSGDGTAFCVQAVGWNDSALRRVTLKNAWTDGLYVVGYGASFDNEGVNLILDDVIVEDCRRNNISVICCDGLYGSHVRSVRAGSTLGAQAGVAPSAGIDFERNTANQLVRNVKFTLSQFSDNISHGAMHYNNYADELDSNVVFDSTCEFVGNGGYGVKFYNNTYSSGPFTVGGTFRGNTSGSMYLKHTTQAVLEGFSADGAILLDGSCADTVLGAGVVAGTVTVNGVSNTDTRISGACRMLGSLADTGLRTVLDSKLLTTVRYNPATSSAFTTTSATFADVSTANLAVTFTVPASGRVLVILEGYGRVDNTNTTMAWNLRDGSGDIAATNRLMFQATQRARLRTSILVTGLTAGTSVTWNWGFASTDGLNTVRVQQGVSTAEGPSIMEVWSV